MHIIDTGSGTKGKLQGGNNTLGMLTHTESVKLRGGSRLFVEGWFDSNQPRS